MITTSSHDSNSECNNCIKSSELINNDHNNNQLVCLILDDLSLLVDGNYYYRKLKIRFTQQSKGKYLWLTNRFESISRKNNYIPLEYSKDKFYIERFLSVNAVDQHQQLKQQRIWESICPELLKNDFEIVYQLYQNVFHNNSEGDWNSHPQLFCLKQTTHWRGFALESVKKDGLMLKNLINDCHHYNSNNSIDKQIVLEAIKQNENAVKFIKLVPKNVKLLEDRMFVLEMVKINGMVYPLLSKGYQQDRQVALMSISNFPSVFTQLNNKFCNDRQFIIDSIQENGKVMDFLPPPFINDRELLLLAIRQISTSSSNRNSANNIDNSSNLKQMAHICVRNGAYFIVLRLEECYNDVEVVVDCLQFANCREIDTLHKIFEMLPQSMKNNKQVIRELLTQILKIIVSFHSQQKKASSAMVFSCVNDILDETEIKNHQDLVLQIFKIIGYFHSDHDDNSLSSSCCVRQLISKFWNKQWESNNEFMIEVVGCGYIFFLYLVDSSNQKAIRNNRAFMLQVLKMYPQAFVYVSIFLRNNRSFMLEVMKECLLAGIDHYHHILECDTLLIEDRQFVLEVVSTIDGNALYYFNDFCNDREVVLRAVENDGYSLQYASEELCADREIVLVAIGNCGKALEFASIELQQDCEMVMEAVRNDPSVLDIVEDHYRFNREIVVEAVKKNYSMVPSDVKFHFRNDREILLEAVRQSNDSNNNNNIQATLKRASINLRDDKELIQEAVKTDPSAIHFASDRLKDDMEIALLVVSSRGDLLEQLSTNMKNVKNVVLAAVLNTPSSLQFASNNLQQDREIVLEALRNGLDFNFFITHSAHIGPPDVDMFLEAIKKDKLQQGSSCVALKQLLQNSNEDVKEQVAIRSGFCCNYDENLFRKRIESAFFGATFLN